jgi:hypothetical protein
VTFEGIDVLRSVGILVLILLRKKVEEDAVNAAHTECSSAEHRVSPTPCSAEHRVSSISLLGLKISAHI